MRPVAGGKYEIIAGERRSRAAAGRPERGAGAGEQPAAAAIVLIANIQREDLNLPEECPPGQRVRLTHEAAAQAVGRSRSAASNLLRLCSHRAGAADAHGRRHDDGPRPRPVALEGAQQILCANEIGQAAQRARGRSHWSPAITPPARSPAARGRPQEKPRDIARIEAEMPPRPLLLARPSRSARKKRTKLLSEQVREVSIQFWFAGSSLNGLLDKLGPEET